MVGKNGRAEAMEFMQTVRKLYSLQLGCVNELSLRLFSFGAHLLVVTSI